MPFLVRVRRTEELAWQERRLMYLQQMHLIRMQISTHVMLHKFEKGSSNIPKVYFPHTLSYISSLLTDLSPDIKFAMFHSLQKSKVVVKSIPDTKLGKSSVKTSVPEQIIIPTETPVGLGVTPSSSVSMASLASDGSKSSAVSNSSRRATGGVPSNGTSTGVGGAGDNGVGGAGDSESSHLEDRVLKGLSELQSRCRFVLLVLIQFWYLISVFLSIKFVFSSSNLKEREKVLHERKQSVEQIIQWRRKLEEEERRLRDVERQTHSRHRSSLTKHVLRGILLLHGLF